MKHCPKCNNWYQAAEQVCFKCNISLEEKEPMGVALCVENVLQNQLKSKSDKKIIAWVVGALTYSVIVAMLPVAIWLVLGLVVDAATWFMRLPWSIKIPVYIAIGVCFQFYIEYRKR